MNKQIICVLLIFLIILPITIYAQNSTESDSISSDLGLFDEQNLLALKFNYSNKELKKETNDSTYIASELSYQNNDSTWTSLNIDLRARGNFRRNNCYFVPIKISIKKKDYKNTKFDGHKKLKLVVPCLLEKDRNDNILKEYLAYKFYEMISPYHFNTRLANIELTELRGKKEKTHSIKGFLIEDDKKIAKQFDGKIVERSIHPMAQEELNSIRCEFFQFMIGNTDFSNLEQHNAKLIYIDKDIYPIPYDFDMSGLVNASYSLVSETLTSKSNISSVTQRMYRGFKRNPLLIEQVRQEFLKRKSDMFQIMDDLKPKFERENEFENAKNYIQNFFNILANEKEFKTEILDQLRS
jgi:hypothetical protein